MIVYLLKLILREKSNYNTKVILFFNHRIIYNLILSSVTRLSTSISKSQNY